uniref:AAA domain-containing protein n=1 Tax=Parastrongyloides trichosuri TaxID=131310 RepID=A0A0N4ZP66_PARTI
MHIDQIEILAKLCGEEKLSLYNIWKDIKNNINSFNLYDLKKLSQRIKIISSKNGHILIEKNDVEESLESLTQIDKIASNKINAFGNDVEWDDVIGMEESKRILIETVIWPSKYKEVYDTCPIRLGRAVILHGPSGVGKSYLIRALIKKCNLYTIIIKGPELLSKYIGSSEENVRKTFEKARQNRPSLLIFEEFDGIAPRRGHDSTGVTDRVVNQLLTEMDGVENLDGVFVIATTSRIDLIDPALLRPGRLDYKIECKYPTQNERILFLKLYIKKMGMQLINDRNCDEEELQNDLHCLGDRMINWSFGELKGALTNTYFMALRRVQIGGDTINEKGEIIKLSIDDIQKGIDESIPKRLLTSQIRDDIKKGINFKTGSRVTLA